MIAWAFGGLAIGLVVGGFVTFLTALLKPESVRNPKQAKLVSIIALGLGMIATGIFLNLAQWTP
jgi:hypothetical protein